MTLPQPFVDAWMKALVELGRFPKGTTLTTTPLPSLIQILAKSERKSVFEMRDAFTRERDRIAKGYLGTRKGVVTYLLGFHLANLVRAIAVWRRTLGRNPALKAALSRYDQVRIRDLGAGTGVMSQAIVHVWQHELKKNPKWDFDLVDLNQLLIEVSRKMLTSVSGEHPTPAAPDGAPTLTVITLGYFWNELSPIAKSKLLKDLDKKVKEDTLIFVAEPASEQEARDAMELRDMLVGLDYQVLYPCSHQSPCPMLRGQASKEGTHKFRDRCYSEFTDKLPPIQQKLDFLFEMERTILAVSGYVFGSPSLLRSSAASPTPAEQAVVVGKPKRKEERGADYLLCREEGLIKVAITERRESNVLKRGEIYGREIPKVDPPKPRETERLREPKKYPAHKPKVPARKRPGVR